MVYIVPDDAGCFTRFLLIDTMVCIGLAMKYSEGNDTDLDLYKRRPILTQKLENAWSFSLADRPVLVRATRSY